MGSFNNLTGMKFNRLTVIEVSHRDKRGAHYWRCRCDCGNVTVMRSNHLRSGHNKSCGCLHKDKAREKFIDLTGLVFGRLTIVSFYGTKGRRESHWNCRCSCGSLVIARGQSLKSGHIKSCGCYNRDVTSKTFVKRGEQHPRWRGGTKEGYAPEWGNRLRESIRNRDGRRCQYPDCDYDDTRAGAEKLQVHHINGDKKNCKEYNLISLCRSHHIKVEWDNRGWDEYFYQLTGDYEYENSVGLS